MSSQNKDQPRYVASINKAIRARLGDRQFPSYIGRSHAQARIILRARGQIPHRVSA